MGSGRGEQGVHKFRTSRHFQAADNPPRCRNQLVSQPENSLSLDEGAVIDVLSLTGEYLWVQLVPLRYRAGCGIPSSWAPTCRLPAEYALSASCLSLSANKEGNSMARKPNRACRVGWDRPGFMSWLSPTGCVILGKSVHLSGLDSSSVHGDVTGQHLL